ncbi:MAG: nucleotidyl transferase AbiEii/AbiGii toxin family protein [bacterium]|nr:nucleotidyl transferase AbiEii/AbiGii toxin family protein [bacterium]
MEIISQVQKAILDNFSQILDSEHFYLTGGTALAHFYLKHRKSNDLDFFTTIEELIIPFSHRLEEGLNAKNMSIQRQRGIHSFVELLVNKDKEITLIHLALDAPFRFEPRREFPTYPNLKVDSLVDIASNKLLALFGRATMRDFIDIYSLIKKGFFTVEELVEKAKRKDPGFDLYWLGIALERINTFNNDSPDMLLIVEPINFKDLLTFFNKWREEIANELKS